MAEAWELATRHQQRVEQIRLQSDLRRQDRIGSEIFDAEIEKLRGENERELVLLNHDLEKENRALDLKFQELQNSQQVRLEAIQTAIKQQDDFFRHFWEIDKEVVRLETRLVEMAVAGRITADQSILDHRNAMEAKTADQGHELRRMSHETDEALRRERGMREMGREFGEASEEDVEAAYARLKNSGKI